MPSNDLVLNVRQIGSYPAAGGAGGTDTVLIQRGGLGGPYMTLTPEALVATALAQGGDMTVAGTLSAYTVEGGSAKFSNGTFGLLSSPAGSFASLSVTSGSFGLLDAQNASVGTLCATFGSVGGSPIATTGYVQQVRPKYLMEQLAVTAVNTLAQLSQMPDMQLFELVVDGRPFFPVGTTPDFSVSGQIVTWLNTTYGIALTSVVIAIYTYVTCP